MKSKRILIVSVFFVLNISYFFAQECNFYNVNNYKNGIYDTIYIVKFQSLGKCPLSTKIKVLEYIPNSSMGFDIDDCHYYIPVANGLLYDISPTLDLFYDNDVQIKIKVRYYENETDNGKPFAIITDVIEFKFPDRWLPTRPD